MIRGEKALFKGKIAMSQASASKEDKQDLLLCVTKKSFQDLPNLPREELFCFPLYRIISRTKYKADLFHFVDSTEPIAKLQDASIPRLTFTECCLRRAQE